jgi:hypothetical protein
MLQRLFTWLKEPSLQSEIDAFIASRNPQSVAEVEYWINHFLFARGSV